MLGNVKKIHMLGIGGIGVSGVARILAVNGFQVSGSDVRESSLTEALRSEGIKVTIGHQESNIEGADLIVLSTAIPETNVELIAAKKVGMRIVHRSEILSAISERYTTIGVTGTHGKGTVSSMIAWMLDVAGEDPGFVIGGMLNNFKTNARPGKGKWMVLEIDESDGTHLNFQPNYVVCNFLEADHLNYYKDLDDIKRTMTKFIDQNGRLFEGFANFDCDGNRELSEMTQERLTGYSIDHKTEFKAVVISDTLPIRFEAFRREISLGMFELNLPAVYNVVNAMAAISIGVRIGLDIEDIRSAISTYQGIENRFTVVQGGGVTIVKDYVSHPTCMRKVLESAENLSNGRIISVFKPYRYTLIKYLQDEYATAFTGSDEVILTTMYAAEEDPIPGIDTEFFVNKIREGGLKVTFIPDQNKINAYLLETVRADDKVLFFGGDDFFIMADDFVVDLDAQK